MPVRRALVDCAVLSLQDSCVFYPCCKGCFSRIDAQQHTPRSRCPKCGYSCLREQVDYRYRLSLRVVRDSHIFGVTVFGTCLNPLFGIHASGLKSLLEDSDAPVEAPTRSILLIKAVEDCFIGRHFTFGIKVTDTDNGPLLGRPVPGSFTSKDTIQYIASQIILPKASGLGGCTVFSYYRSLLQKAAGSLLRSTDNRLPETTFLLVPDFSPSSSFNNTTLPASCLLSQPLLRSQHHDCTLSPTPPWQQSLGLVTSSAEQEEGCSTQDREDENSRQVHNKRPPRRHAPKWQRSCWQKHELTGEAALSPLASVYKSNSFTKNPDSYISRANGNSPIPHAWSSPSPPGHSRTLPLSSRVKRRSEREQTKQSLSSSVAWEDLLFSESLTEFLRKDDEAFDRCSETEANLIALNQKETTGSDTSLAQLQDENSSHESVLLCQSNTQLTDAHSDKRVLLDVTNTASNGGDVTLGYLDQTHKDLDGHENRWQASNVCSHECKKEEEKPGLVSFKNSSDEEEQLGEDAYDCSADLFSSSAMISVNTQTLDMRAETDRKMSDTHNKHIFDTDSLTEVHSLQCLSDTQNFNSEKAVVNMAKYESKGCWADSCDSSLSPGTQDLNNDKNGTIDMIQCDYSQCLDFIPPSQSTPIVKVGSVSGLRVSTRGKHTLGEFSSQVDRQDSYTFPWHTPGRGTEKPAKITSSICKLNSFRANQLHQCGSREDPKDKLLCSPQLGRRSHRTAPKRRFWTLDKPKQCLLAQQHLRLHRGRAVNRGSTERRTNQCDTSLCDYEENEKMLSPSTTETLLPVKPRRGQTSDCSWDLGSAQREQQTSGINCERTLSDQTSARTGMVQTQPGNGACSQLLGGERAASSQNTSAHELNLDGSNSHSVHNDDEACDWSRDLFSDSV